MKKKNDRASFYVYLRSSTPDFYSLYVLSKTLCTFVVSDHLGRTWGLITGSVLSGDTYIVTFTKETNFTISNLTAF